MEASETPKRKQRTVTKPYQKHKVDYKIVIEHKLNKSYSHTKDPELRQYDSLPLYIEIRAKRQTAFVPSRLIFYSTPLIFDQYFNLSIVQRLIEREKKDILESLTPIIEEKGDEFRIFEWYECYKKEIFKDKVVLDAIIARIFKENFIELLVKEGIDKSFYKILCESNTRTNELIKSVYLATVLEKLNVKGFRSFFYLHLTFVKKIWFKLEIESKNPNENYRDPKSATIHLTTFFSLSDIKSGFFKRIISEFLDLDKDEFARKALEKYEKLILDYDLKRIEVSGK
ncbi:hypothetical protein [Runella aurantiaca]|uniref:Uncharacterized protein n=1 Tax=Runella aurantiaca TaxID=2282308 RepID=A0A369IAX6_9BACT|nr:hypothetical protein [Runella aurantiaca]RDB05607.1 hypothetical protein DVG78_13605 [Runella aurantiaca]